MRAVLLLLLVAATAAAQEPKKTADGDIVREISFQDAIDLGLARNLGLKSVRLDALMRRLVVAIEEAAWDTTFETEVGGGESLTPSRSQLAGAQVLDTDSANWTMGVSKPFRFGPTLGINWRMDRSFSNSTFNTINPAYDTALELTLNVPLLRGRGREVNEADLRASQASADSARWNLLDQSATLIGDIAEAYWELVYLQRRVAVLEKSVSVAREIETTERRKLRPEIGRSTILDVTQAAAETKRREVALIEGRNQVGDQADTLRSLILPFTGGRGDNVVLRAMQKPVATLELPKLHLLVSDALARRPDLRRIDAELRRLQQSVVKAENGLRYQLDLRASIAWRGVDGSFEDSTGQTFSGDFPSSRASIIFSVPFGRRAAKAELRRARLDVSRERLTRDAKVNEIVVEVRRAYRRIKTSIEQIGALREEVKAAEVALDGERKRRDRGSSTVIDVSRLEENLTDALLRQTQAHTNLERARVELLRASGRLIEAFGIKLGPELEAGR